QNPQSPQNAVPLRAREEERKARRARKARLRKRQWTAPPAATCRMSAGFAGRHAPTEERQERKQCGLWRRLVFLTFFGRGAAARGGVRHVLGRRYSLFRVFRVFVAFVASGVTERG